MDEKHLEKKFITRSENLIIFAQTLNEQNDYQEILRLVAENACTLLYADKASILMFNPQTHETVKTMYRQGSKIVDKKYHVLNTMIVGWMLDVERSFITPDIKTDDRFLKGHFDDLNIQSALGAPIKVEGNLLGSIVLFNCTRGEAFSEEDKFFLEGFAAVVAPYLRNLQKIQQFFEPPLPESALLDKYKQAGLIGRSTKFKELVHAIEAAARCDVRVLLEGKSGTGKELIARAIHKFSSRNSKPFIAIDCGAIPPHLIESELFGHVRGAFTGAVSDRKGLLDEANHGTLFMDEIANLPVEVQSKFMRFLQEGEIRPVGSNKTRQVNVRIISASSRQLQKLVEAGQFREDLFYRLHVYPIHVPALNQRTSDIPLLAHRFLKRFSSQQNKKALQFNETMLEFFKQRQWTGNIRELENLIERLVTLAPPDKEILDHHVLPPELKRELKRMKPDLEDRHVPKSLEESLAEYEEQLIRAALIEYDWNQSRAARALKIPVATIRYKMNKLGISRPS